MEVTQVEKAANEDAWKEHKTVLHGLMSVADVGTNAIRTCIEPIHALKQQAISEPRRQETSFLTCLKATSLSEEFPDSMLEKSVNRK